MIIAILQARYTSTRLPGKVLKSIVGKPMLALQIERILRSRMIDVLIVATSLNTEDDAIEAMCKTINVPCFRGSLNDVLDRFYKAAQPYHPDHVARLTGDCPLIDPEIIDATIQFYLDENFDYVSNAMPPETFPDGLDTEIFSFSVLEMEWKEALLPSHREHVTQFIIKHPERFSSGHYKNNIDLSHLRWTVDNLEDFILIKRIYETLYPANPSFTTSDILALLAKNPQLSEINRHLSRNQGLIKSLHADQLFITNNNQ